jgi:hypothetical protein
MVVPQALTCADAVCSCVQWLRCDAPSVEPAANVVELLIAERPLKRLKGTS